MKQGNRSESQRAENSTKLLKWKELGYIENVCHGSSARLHPPKRSDDLQERDHGFN